jgi:hypothetical protein
MHDGRTNKRGGHATFDHGEIDLFLLCRDKRGFLGMLGEILIGKSAKD